MLSCVPGVKSIAVITDGPALVILPLVAQADTIITSRVMKSMAVRSPDCATSTRAECACVRVPVMTSDMAPVAMRPKSAIEIISSMSVKPRFFTGSSDRKG